MGFFVEECDMIQHAVGWLRRTAAALVPLVALTTVVQGQAAARSDSGPPTVARARAQMIGGDTLGAALTYRKAIAANPRDFGVAGEFIRAQELAAQVKAHPKVADRLSDWDVKADSVAKAELRGMFSDLARKDTQGASYEFWLRAVDEIGRVRPVRGQPLPKGLRDIGPLG